MIDDFWIELKQTHQEFTKSPDNGYHFGCLQADYASLDMIEELKNRLAGHLGRMLTDLYRLVVALDYPWTEVWGDRIRLQKKTRDSPRAMFGERSPPSAKHISSPSSGGNPSAGPQAMRRGGDPSVAGLPKGDRPGVGYTGDPSPGVKGIADKFNKMAMKGGAPTFVAQDPTLQTPKVLPEPTRQMPGAGSASIHPGHIWAFFDSAYTVVDLSKAVLEVNVNRTDPSKRWMGISFKEHIVYRLSEGKQRSTARRGANRDSFLERYEKHQGTLGSRVAALHGHITLTYNIDATLGDNPDFSSKVGEVFSSYLKAQYENGNPAAMPWLSKRVLGKLRDGSSSGGDPTGGLFIEAYWCNNYYVPTEDIRRKSETWMVDLLPQSPFVLFVAVGMEVD
jgi:hypothetical protein